MTILKQYKKIAHAKARRFGLATVALVAPVVLAGCGATADRPPPAATVEIFDEVGLTITEQLTVQDRVREDYSAALRQLTQGSIDDGIAGLEGVIENAPALAAPQIDLAVAHHVAGDLEAAERHLLAALDLNPRHPVVHNELGIVYRKTGRFADARRSYESALGIYPGYHHARRNLAILCDLYLGDLNCALENYLAYMATVPGDDEVEMWIADLRMRIGE